MDTTITVRKKLKESELKEFLQDYLVKFMEVMTYLWTKRRRNNVRITLE